MSGNRRIHDISGFASTEEAARYGCWATIAATKPSSTSPAG